MAEPDPPAAAVPYVLLACAGLDHARRGFESFARECFGALRADPGVRIELVKGSGVRAAGERAIPTLRRDALICRALGRIRNTRAFRIEALAFAFGLQPVLLHRRPDVVFVSEWDTARALAAIRTRLRQRFKLVLSNGGFAADDFDHLDHVQQLTPAAREYVLARGADPRRHSVLPLGVQIERELSAISEGDQRQLRERLGLPTDRPILLSVAALNRYHKRLDYLVEEVAALPAPRPFLVLLGQEEEETPAVRALATAKLGEDGYTMRSVPAPQVVDFYRASHAFVLTSLAEAQGRVLIEASAQGMPCLVHDYSSTRFALGAHGLFGDFTRPGGLTALLLRHDFADEDKTRAVARHDHAYEKFSWERLRPRYVEFFRAVAGMESCPRGSPRVDANSTVSSWTAENVSRYRE
jgi:glycosyltransferase involved in cell wall biosynthesis